MKCGYLSVWEIQKDTQIRHPDQPPAPPRVPQLIPHLPGVVSQLIPHLLVVVSQLVPHFPSHSVAKDPNFLWRFSFSKLCENMRAYKNYAKLCGECQIMRNYAENGILCEKLRNLTNYAIPQPPQLNGAYASDCFSNYHESYFLWDFSPPAPALRYIRFGRRPSEYRLVKSSNHISRINLLPLLSTSQICNSIRRRLLQISYLYISPA